MATTLLDHSSVDALRADLKRNRDGVFRFEYMDLAGWSYLSRRPWRLVHAAGFIGGFMEIHVDWDDGVPVSEIAFQLDSGWLIPLKPHLRTGGCDAWRVLLDDSAGGERVLPRRRQPDNSRNRLDDNLREIFS